MNKGKYNFEVLPERLKEKLQSLFATYRDYRGTNNLLLIVGSICNKQIPDDSFTYSYLPLSVAYWRKVIGSHYHQYLKALMDNNIIQSDGVIYTSDAGVESHVKGYRINPELLQGKFSKMDYSGNTSESKSADVVSDIFEGNKHMIQSGFNQESITIEKTKAMEWIKTGLTDVVNSYKNPEFVHGVPKTLPVLVRLLNDDGSFNSIHISVEAAQKIADKQRKKLFYYNEKFIITDEDTLNRIALQNLTINYEWQVRSFMPEKFNFSRNGNTLRVYSKLASLPSALLPFIRISGKYLIQADLKCSQFTIFANLLNYYLNHSGDELKVLYKKKPCKTFVSNLVTVFDKHKCEFPDEGLNTKNPVEDIYDTNNIYKFLVDSLLHDFYKIIKTELNLPQRQHGKSIAFRTVFSKTRPENELVRQFRELYPGIVGIINDFKEKYQYNQFAIGLQRLEAEMFIDRVWKRAITSGINSFTRHDSIIFPISEKDKVEKIITEVFNEFDFIYRFEYEIFNQEEIEARLVEQTDYLDSQDDFDSEFLYKIHEARKDAQHDKLINFVSENLAEIDLPDAIMNDYFGILTVDALIWISRLEGLRGEVKLCVEEDIANLQSNYPVPFFREKTNKLIRWLVRNIS